MDFKVLIADSAIADLKEIVEFSTIQRLTRRQPGGSPKRTSYRSHTLSI